jgi:hypothetical protein
MRNGGLDSDAFRARANPEAESNRIQPSVLISHFSCEADKRLSSLFG